MTIHDSPTAFAAGRNGQYMLQPTSDELQHMRVSALSSDIQRIPKRCVQLNSLVDRQPPQQETFLSLSSQIPKPSR
jgi:hypothetical protein